MSPSCHDVALARVCGRQRGDAQSRVARLYPRLVLVPTRIASGPRDIMTR
jgi:hypothetical protein